MHNATSRQRLQLAKAIIIQQHGQAASKDTSQASRLAATCDKAWLQRAPLFDICLVTAALYVADRRLISGEHWAQLAKRLVAAETEPGGPYADSAVRHAALDTNVAIAFLFRAMQRPLPRVEQFVASSIAKGEAQASDPFLAVLLAQLHTAKHQADEPPKSTHGPRSPLYQRVRQQIQTQPKALRATLLANLQQVEHADRHNEIAGFAELLNLSLKHTAVASSTTEQLGIANIYCWMAYMSFDHLLDKIPQAQLLPGAAFCLRRAVAWFRQVSPDPTLHDRVQTAFDRADYANAWELRYARADHTSTTITLPTLPDYGGYRILAMRSEPHILGALLLAQQSQGQTEQIKHLAGCLHHYLIAKQLSDDIHDWRQDMQAGQLSAVVCCLLRQMSITAGSYRKWELLAAMQQMFWQRTMSDVSAVILYHVAEARRGLRASALCSQTNPLDALFGRIEQATRAALEQRQTYQRFLHDYSSQ